MSLKDIYYDYFTDKFGWHTYLDIYHNALLGKEENIKSVLEIGIKSGVSLKLWHKLFPNATIHGIDNDLSQIKEQFSSNDRIYLYPDDAYSLECIEKFNFSRFDLMIDDGPHTFESMIFFVDNYVHLLRNNGIFIIEDIQDYEWCIKLSNILSLHKAKYKVEIHDNRHIKNIHDDILLIGYKIN